MTASSGRFDYLDGLRALAIGAVLALHWLSWYSPFLHGGSIGVDIFFVLSGFIITTMLWRSPIPTSLAGAWWRFIKRRFIRLYPALLGLVLFTLLLFAVDPDAPLSLAAVAERGALALTQGTALWAADSTGGLWLSSLHPFAQTWSLALEWYFYLLWPLILLAARMRGATAKGLATGSLIVAAALYAFSLPMNVHWFYFGPTARFAELLAGAALALWFQAGAVPVRPLRFATPAAAIALAAIAAYCLLAPGAASPLYRYVGVPMTVVATVVLIYTGYRNQGGWVQRLLSHPWLAAVGRLSYSLYLWHLVPILLLERSSLPTPVMGLLAVSATILLTLASYHFLERPFLRPRSDVLAPVQRGRAAAPSR